MKINLTKKSPSNKIYTTLFLLTTVSISMAFPLYALAVVPGVPTVSSQIIDVAPTSVSRTKDSASDFLKNFSLDKLASIAAKQILHQMTVATINWINSGFNGSPAFLTNPSGFFLDVADQATGDLISQSGPLKSLCSPWSVDVRLALALNQTQPLGQRFSCTLDSVINNAENATVNGHSIQGFINGDFSQGGWGGFIALTAQNNPYNDYLQAHSQQLQAIGLKQSSISQDLLQGHGFLSWQSCTDVPNPAANSSGPTTAVDLYDSEGPTGNGTSQGIPATVPDCQTQTPGSVIENSLEANTSSGVRQLELANDINSVVNALVSQLMSQMLSKGLHSLSSGGSGVSSNGQSTLQAYTAQLENDATSNKTVGVTTQNTSTVTSSTLSGTAAYDQAISIVSDSLNRYETARACLANSGSNNRAGVSSSIAITSIDNAVTNRVQPLLTSLRSKETAYVAQNPTSGANSNSTATVVGSTNIDDINQNIQDQVNGYLNQVSTTVDAANTSGTGDTSSADLADAQNQAQSFDSDAAQYQAMCNSGQTTLQ